MYIYTDDTIVYENSAFLIHVAADLSSDFALTTLVMLHHHQADLIIMNECSLREALCLECLLGQTQPIPQLQHIHMIYFFRGWINGWFFVLL